MQTILSSKILSIGLLVLCIIATVTATKASKANAVKDQTELVRGLLIMTDAQSVTPALQMELDGEPVETALAGLATSVYGLRSSTVVTTKEKRQASVQQFNAYHLFLKDSHEVRRRVGTQESETPFNGIQLGERRISVPEVAENWTSVSMVVTGATLEVSLLPQEIAFIITEESTLEAVSDLEVPTVTDVSVAWQDGEEESSPKFDATVQWKKDSKTIVLNMDPDEYDKRAQRKVKKATKKPVAVSVRLEFSTAPAAAAVAPAAAAAAPAAASAPSGAPVVSNTTTASLEDLLKKLPFQKRFLMTRSPVASVQFAAQAFALNHTSTEGNGSGNGPILAMINTIILGILSLLIFGTFAFGMGAPYAYEMGMRARLVNAYKGDIAEPTIMPPSPVLPVPSSPPTSPQVVVNNFSASGAHRGSAPAAMLQVLG